MKTGIEQNTNTWARDGLWGQVCTGLGIPNTKIHRIRLQVAHQSFKKVCTYHIEVLSQCCVRSLLKFWGAHSLTLMLVAFRSKHTSPSSPSPQASGTDEPGEQYSEVLSHCSHQILGDTKPYTKCWLCFFQSTHHQGPYRHRLVEQMNLDKSILRY